MAVDETDDHKIREREWAGNGVQLAEQVCEKILAGVQDHAIFALDGAGNVDMWNLGAERLTGYAAAEVVGQPYTLFGSHDDGGDVARILQSARNTGSFQQERWWRRRDGGLVWVDEVVSPLDGGFIVITRDLTDRVELEERRTGTPGRAAPEPAERALRAELHAAERRASFLAEASSILVATSLDFDSTVKALARLAVSRLADWCVIHSLDRRTGLKLAEVAHRDPEKESALARSVDDNLSDVWSNAISDVLQTGQAHICHRFQIATWFDDSEVLLPGLDQGSAMITPLLGRGTVLGTVTFVAADRDREYNDEDLALAEELGRRAAIALDNARLYRDAQDANRAKADFLAVISHELRTPLNAIMGYSDLLDAQVKGELTDPQRKQVDRIRASARHLLQLIEEILSFARMEAGGAELRLQQADAGSIAREAAAIIEPMAQARGLDLRVDVRSDQPLHTDPGKVRQVLVNLLSNAVKFTESGGHIELRVGTEGRDVVYDVIDTGIGIPEADLSRIFDPFWQVERPNTRRVGGTGLGLTVSRRYVRLLHGKIEVSSEPGRGTHVRVRLPLQADRSP